MKSLISNSILLGLAGAAALVVGCSSGPQGGSSSSIASNGGNVGGGDVGRLGMRLSLPDGTSIDSVGYSLSNGATTVQSGTLATNHSQSIDFQLGQIPAGPGYTITLTAASGDGGVTCLGTAGPFAVVGHSTVNETVQLICQSGANNNGNIFISGVPDFCGTWNSVSTIGPGLDAAPTNGSEVLADGVTPIVITATATGASPSSLRYTWTATTITGNGVTIQSNVGNGTTTDTLTVTCNSDAVDAVGSAQLTLVVSDSLDGGSVTCPTSLSTVSTTVFCDKIATCSAPTTNCGTGGNLVCVNEQTDNNNCGSCGHVCSGATPSCVAGVCSALVCAAPTTNCGGVCVNEQTDPNNCGTCGHSCGGGACVAGACVLSPQQQCNNFLAASEPGSETGNVCSPSELLAFQKDTTGNCLDCLLNTGGCLNSATQGVSGKECEDPFTGAGASTTEAECLSVLGCDLGLNPVHSPAPGATGALPTYCGTQTQATCATDSPATAAPGLCAAQIVAGFPAGSTAGTISSNIAVPTFAAGRAGLIIGCAVTAGCSSCLN